jgi:hypothetical protein
VQFIESQDSQLRPLHPGFVANNDESRVEDDEEDRPFPPANPVQDTEDVGEPEGAGDDVEQEVQDKIPEENPPPVPRRSARAYAPSAAGTASRGEAREGPLDRAHREVQESAERRAAEKGARREQVNALEEDEGYLLTAELDDPRTYKQAMATQYAPEWDSGYDDEMASLKSHNVWTLIPRSNVPAGWKIVGSRPHFHTKRDEKGEITQHKVCVVAKGYSQVQGVDYTDTYAPVARMESMHSILHIGAVLDWEMHQLDVKTAFLHGDLEEEVYMEQSEGRKEPGKEDWVCQLNKTLYGLKQAGRGWSARLHREMVNVGFERLDADHSIYVRKSKSGNAVVGVHVDDMAATTTDLTTLNAVVCDLQKVLDIVDMGPIKRFLGMEVV